MAQISRPRNQLFCPDLTKYELQKNLGQPELRVEGTANRRGFSRGHWPEGKEDSPHFEKACGSYNIYYM